MGTPPEENKPNVTEELPTKPATLHGIVKFCKSNIADTIAYAIIAVSLLYCFFDAFVGEIPVGFILGIYFSSYVFKLAAQFRDFLMREGVFRGFVVIAGMLAVAIGAPGLCLGLVVGVFTRPLFGQSTT
jgi:hypothetical protein